LTCSLPHKLGKVTRGRLYSFLPLIYGDVAALILGESARYAGYTRSFYQELKRHTQGVWGPSASRDLGLTWIKENRGREWLSCP
jgi:hypothetical protein